MPFDWENFTYDTAWLQEAVQIEAEAGCDIQIGAKASASVPLPIEPTQLQTQLKQVRLQSLLFGELRILLKMADLGAGMEAALTEGRQLIRARLQHLTPEQHQCFEALMVEDATPSEDQPLRAQLRQVLCSLLVQADWQQIAQAAMKIIQTHLLEQVALR